MIPNTDPVAAPGTVIVKVLDGEGDLGNSGIVRMRGAQGFMGNQPMMQPSSMQFGNTLVTDATRRMAGAMEGFNNPTELLDEIVHFEVEHAVEVRYNGENYLSIPEPAVRLTEYRVKK